MRILRHTKSIVKTLSIKQLVLLAPPFFDFLLGFSSASTCRNKQFFPYKPLVIFGLLAGSQARFSRRTRDDHLSTRKEPSDRGLISDGPIRFPQTPSQCPRSRTGTLEQGGRSTLFMEPPFFVRVRPAGDPVDSDPGATTLGWSPLQIELELPEALDVSPHRGSRRSCPG